MPIFILVVQTFSFAGPAPRAFFWKGKGSLAACVTATNALYTRLNEAATHERPPPPPPRVFCLHLWELARPFTAHPDVK